MTICKDGVSVRMLLGNHVHIFHSKIYGTQHCTAVCRMSAVIESHSCSSSQGSLFTQFIQSCHEGTSE